MELIIDARQADWRELARHAGTEAIEISHLMPDGFNGLERIEWPRLRWLSFRHLRAGDLRVLRLFPQLEKLRVWQSEHVTTLNGIEAQPRLRWLDLRELGVLPSLGPLCALANIEELMLLGGVWKDQKLAGDFSPLAALSQLRRLTIANVRGPASLEPISKLPKLEELWIATALFPVDEVARIAAAYPFWAERRPWVQPFENDPDGCGRCGRKRTILLLQRKKRLWCEACDRESLQKVLSRFDALVEEHRLALRP